MTRVVEHPKKTRLDIKVCIDVKKATSGKFLGHLFAKADRAKKEGEVVFLACEFVPAREKEDVPTILTVLNALSEPVVSPEL
jgi:hypothetical protein